ncbi:hypothetical protein [Moorena producens]|uniref:hypothetical protein n=1 Tax=Moorena producens TaxID=1155739 RepID=UPI0011EA6528|nr:hypothetical protein [Moorena producens]
MQSLMGRGCVRNLRPHLVSPVETPKTALHRFIKSGKKPETLLPSAFCLLPSAFCLLPCCCAI